MRRLKSDILSGPMLVRLDLLHHFCLRSDWYKSMMGATLLQTYDLEESH